MITRPPTPTNDVTSAVKANGQSYIFIQSTADGRPYSTQVHLSDGTSLGAVQSVTWSLSIGDVGSRCVVETIATPADLVALMEHTTVKVRPWGHPVVWVATYYWAKLRRVARNLFKRLS
jgi:hypothetical protein